MNQGRADLSCGGASRSYDGFIRSGASSSWYPDLSVPQQHHDLCKRVWEAWVAEITNRKNHKRIWIWINTFHLAAQMAKVYDIESVNLHGSDTKLNIKLGSPDYFCIPRRRVVSKVRYCPWPLA
ncbi:hypothetical protein QYE76_012067 [Lolium multiflorum]|uniref:AP2/ERF domain-containing protein n=1 Tax=Lolium multiflorum TaxID=4521 RepID=A0AAD8U0D8_LOLMU|nr:hypothetical protein QYE76_012067 [Lolium multiflorum]